MRTDTVEIPTSVLSSVETLDELQDWLAAQNPKVVSELCAARREDRAGKFKVWKPRHPPCPAGLKQAAILSTLTYGAGRRKNP